MDSRAAVEIEELMKQNFITPPPPPSTPIKPLFSRLNIPSTPIKEVKNITIKVECIEIKGLKLTFNN